MIQVNTAHSAYIFQFDAHSPRIFLFFKKVLIFFLIYAKIYRGEFETFLTQGRPNNVGVKQLHFYITSL